MPEPQKSKNNKKISGGSNIVAATLLTVIILDLQPYFSQSPSKFDVFQQYCLISFAIAIPGLALWYFLTKYKATVSLSDKTVVSIGAILLLSAFSALIGVAFTFMHYYFPAGVVFIIMTAISLIYSASAFIQSESKS